MLNFHYGETEELICKSLEEKMHSSVRLASCRSCLQRPKPYLSDREPSRDHRIWHDAKDLWLTWSTEGLSRGPPL